MSVLISEQKALDIITRCEEIESFTKQIRECFDNINKSNYSKHILKSVR